MPDFCAPRRGVRQTLDAALSALRTLGVGVDRVCVEVAGPGWIAGTVLRQNPPPNTPLGPGDRVGLIVAGCGVFEALPYAFRTGDDREFGADRLMAVLDGPLQKLAAHVRTGGAYLELRPEDPIAALRWIADLFGIDPSPWPDERRYAVARLLPHLHRIAGTVDSVPYALRAVFDLPSSPPRPLAGVVPVGSGKGARLGPAGARLGIDSVAGGGLRIHAGLRVTIGPVGLETYLAGESATARAERYAVYRLVLPATVQHVEERWLVRDSEAPRLADAERGPRLGVNAELGRTERSTL
jgi:hypothetical protein